MRLLKVLWQHQGMEKATWEREDTIRTNYPFLFEERRYVFSHLILNYYYICI